MTDPLDDLIQNTRDDVPVSPQDEDRHKKKLSADKFFNAAKELASDGTYKGKIVNPEDRKIAFKKAKKDDRVGFKSFLDDVTKKSEGEGEKGNDKWFKAINENLKSILGAMDARAKVDEDAAKTTKQKDEKAARQAKEASGERPKGGPVKGIINKITQPITSIWEKIIQGFGVLLAGWGLDKVLKWFQNNPQAATDLGTFLSNHLPKIFGGILALLALDIGIKIAKFAAVIVKGTAWVIAVLWKMVGAIVAFCIANPLLALAIGLGALLVGGAVWAASRKKSTPKKEDQKPFKSDSNFEVENDGKVTKAAGGGLIRGYAEGGEVEGGEKEVEGGEKEVTSDTGKEIVRKKELDEKIVREMPLDNLYTSGEDMEESGLDDLTGQPEETGIMDVMSGKAGLKTAGSLIPSDTQAFDEGGEVKKLTWTNPDVQANAEGTDTEPAMLRPDQFVMSKGAVNKFGVSTLEGMNAAGGMEARGDRELGQPEFGESDRPELPDLEGGGGGTGYHFGEQAKTKTWGSAIRDVVSGDDGRSRRMTEEEKSQRMSGGGKVQRFSGGGKSDARGTDTVPAMLTPGEFVMSRGAVQKWGVGTLEGMNAAGGGTNKPKIAERVYAAGGGGIGVDGGDKGFANITNTMETSTSDSEGNFSVGVRYVGPEEAKKFLEERGFPSMELMDGTVVPDFGKIGAEKLTEGLQLVRNMMVEQKAPPDRIAKLDELISSPHAKPDHVANIINQLVPGSWDHALAQESESINKKIKGSNLNPIQSSSKDSNSELISPNTDGSESTASQLMSSPPGGGRSSSDVTILPIPTGKEGSIAAGPSDSEIPWHKAHDDTNLSSLIIKNLYQIVQ